MLRSLVVRARLGIPRGPADGAVAWRCLSTSRPVDPRVRQIVAGHLYTDDVAAACDWYGEVFPTWEITRADNTAVASVGGAHAASISARGADDPVGWVPVVSVESCDDTAARIADAGGSSAPVNGAAFHTLLGRDPDGGAFQVSEMPEELHQPLPQAQPVPGMANWGDILTDDGRESALTAFYLSALGWKQEAPAITMPEAAGGGEYITLSDGRGRENKFKLCGCLPRRLLAPWLDSTAWMVAFSLEDKDAVERAVSLGKGLAGPIDADGWIALVADPSGHMVGAYARCDDWHAIKGEP